jgi:hypothetical protein
MPGPGAFRVIVRGALALEPGLPHADADRVTAAAPALSGTLDEFSLDAVLSLLASSAQTGALHFTGPRPGSLWFAEGAVYRASPEPEGDTDGQDVHDRIVDTLFELMVTGESFEFCRGDTAEESGASFAVSDVVAEAAERVEQWKAIATTIPSTAAVLRLSPQLPGRRTKCTVTAQEWEVLALLDGRRPVADVMRAVGRNSFDVMATMHHFVDTGLAEVVAEG